MSKDPKHHDKKQKDWGKIREERQEENLSDAEGPQEEKELSHFSYQELEDKLTQAEQQAHENWEKAVRATAELENVRRRAEREVQNAHRFGVEKLVQSLIPVLDSIEQAMQLAQQHEDIGMYEGLALTQKIFLESLFKAGVVQLDPMGEPFDPQKHEAMSIQIAPNTTPNTVIAVFQKGFELNDRVIRPARVVVAKNSD